VEVDDDEGEGKPFEGPEVGLPFVAGVVDFGNKFL
jgi:hypothetical protein